MVDERDELKLAVTARESELATLHGQFDAESARAKDLETRLDAALKSSTDLTSQNLDLAGRLTMAQIRRLEAEKKWLELALSQPSRTVAAVENARGAPAGPKTESATLRAVPPAAEQLPEKHP